MSKSTDYKPVDHWILLHGQAQLTVLISLTLTAVQFLSLRGMRAAPLGDFTQMFDETMHMMCIFSGIASIMLISAPSIAWSNVLQHRSTTFHDRVWPPLELERSHTFGTIAMVACLFFFVLSNVTHIFYRTNVGFISLVFSALILFFVFAYTVDLAVCFFTCEESKWPELVPQRPKSPRVKSATSD